jgi:hypothetical protein
VNAPIDKIAERFGLDPKDWKLLEKAMRVSPKLEVLLAGNIVSPRLQLLFFRFIVKRDASRIQVPVFSDAVHRLYLNRRLCTRVVCEFYLLDFQNFYEVMSHRRFSPDLAIQLAHKRDLSPSRVISVLVECERNGLRLKPKTLRAAWQVGWKANSEEIKKIVANLPGSDSIYLEAWLQDTGLQALALQEDGVPEEDIKLLSPFFWE